MVNTSLFLGIFIFNHTNATKLQIIISNFAFEIEERLTIASLIKKKIRIHIYI